VVLLGIMSRGLELSAKGKHVGIHKTGPLLLLAALMIGSLEAPAQPTDTKTNFNEATNPQAKTNSDTRGSTARPICGCARPRIIRRPAPIIVTPTQGISAFVESGPKGAKIDWFELDFFDSQQSVGADPKIPLKLERFKVAQYGQELENRSQLVRVRANAPDPRSFYIGMQLSPNVAPKDVVKATISMDLETTQSPLEPPHFDQLWLGPLQFKESETCGNRSTLRIIFQMVGDAAKPPALLVRRWFGTESQGRPEVALLDTRHTSVFGLGFVEGCGQGIRALSDGPMRLSIQGVAPNFSLGDAWEFLVGPEMGSIPLEISRPSSAGQMSEPNPFLAVNYESEPGLGHAEDRAALTTMGVVVSASIILAAIIRVLYRRRRRLPSEVECPECQHHMELDLADPSIDGMFCPVCGKVSIFVSIEADGTRRARIFRLEKSS
jgi:hypothetical protein